MREIEIDLQIYEDDSLADRIIKTYVGYLALIWQYKWQILLMFPVTFLLNFALDPFRPLDWSFVNTLAYSIQNLGESVLIVLTFNFTQHLHGTVTLKY